MNFCTVCGQHYYGSGHQCFGTNRYFAPPTYYPIDTSYLLIPLLERIAVALEKIAKIEKEDAKSA